MADQVYWHASQDAQVGAAKVMDEHLVKLLGPVSELDVNECAEALRGFNCTPNYPI